MGALGWKRLPRHADPDQDPWQDHHGPYLPNGRWLRYRGHLERFSENLLSGATNAATGEIGKTGNVITGAPGQPIAAVARDYRSRGLRWVIVGDGNYGEGSSREHAALSPRLLGGAAVIARSFARIHESNLKKQGLLALTFSRADDYERIRAGDRLSLLGLRELAAGKPVICRLIHSDGTEEAIELEHYYSERQLAWFRAGSALNTISRRRRCAAGEAGPLFLARPRLADYLSDRTTTQGRADEIFAALENRHQLGKSILLIA